MKSPNVNTNPSWNTLLCPSLKNTPIQQQTKLMQITGSRDKVAK